MSPSRDFGKIINERRLALGYSLGQLANRMGTTATKVRSWERGDAFPHDQMLDQLAEELNMSGDVLRATLPSPEPDLADEEDAAVPMAVFSDAADTAASGADDGDGSEPAASAPTEEDAEPTATVAAVLERHDAGDDGEGEEAPQPQSTDAPVEEETDALVEETDVPELAADSGEQPLDEGDGAATGIDDDDEGRLLADLPTEAVPVLPAPPPPERAPAAVAPAAMVRTVPAPPRVDPNDLGIAEPSGLLAPVERFMAVVFDPDRNYLFWIRIILIILVFAVFLRVLAWAVPEFFDALADILDTIESTPSDSVPGPDFIESG